MNKYKKLALIIVFVMFFLWCLRYYQLNDGKLVTHEYPEKIYGLNEKVEYGEDIVYGKDDRSTGYAVTLLDKRIVDCEDYLDEIGKTEKDFNIYLPERVMEVTLNISNINNDDLTQGVEFFPIWLIGRDWHEVYSSEFTAYANDIYEDDTNASFGIQVKQGKSYEIKLIYPMRRLCFSSYTWKNIDEESMWLTITSRPNRKLICVQ